MHALGSGYAASALSHPNHYRLMFMTEHPPIKPETSSLKQNNAEQDAYFQLKSAVQDAHDAGYFWPDLHDADLIAQTILAGNHGACSLQITMAHDTWVNWADVAARLELMQQMISHGLLKE